MTTPPTPSEVLAEEIEDFSIENIECSTLTRAELADLLARAAEALRARQPEGMVTLEKIRDLWVQWGGNAEFSDALNALEEMLRPVAWMFTNEEGDDEFGNNWQAIKGKRYKDGPPVPLYTMLATASSGGKE